ncbi:hypothetical protein B0T20DRAFT_71592 [Sordaria brevicollis]|uniref:Uncharacterized protein n=1 Tax=Sordaria brevicollis TaxID=83679 RepID=A0AAE0P2J9_SORBR|nr:hypothetical protein B0T20DRAFT_71592 [Sordaria brevicollis]
MASPSHFQFQPVTVRVAAAGSMPIREIEPTTAPEPRHRQVHTVPTFWCTKGKVALFSQVAKEVTSRSEVAKSRKLYKQILGRVTALVTVLPVPVSASASLGQVLWRCLLPSLQTSKWLSVGFKQLQAVVLAVRLDRRKQHFTSNGKEKGPASLVAAQRSITPRVHTWWPCINGRLLQTTHLTWRAGASLVSTLKARLVYGRHCKALSFVPRRHFIKLHLPACLNMARPSKTCLPLPLPYLTSALVSLRVPVRLTFEFRGLVSLLLLLLLGHNKLQSRQATDPSSQSTVTATVHTTHLTHHHRPALAHLAAFRVHYRTSTA